MGEKSGSDLIAAECKRQKEVEGWTPEHDDEHTDGSIASAAICYLTRSWLWERFVGKEAFSTVLPMEWPGSWASEWWKPLPAPGKIITRTHIIRMLVKAGALIAAEIDRLQRLKEREARGDE